LRYESSPALKDALLDNLLVNLKGTAGAFHEADLLQEHFNLWLEDYIQKHGGDFDDHFFRSLIAPNVFHFLSIKDHFQIAFELVPRSKSHISPNLADQLKVLMMFFEQQEVHLFVSSRTRGHVARNTLANGYDILDMGKLDTYLRETTDHMDIIRLIVSSRDNRNSTLTRSVGESVAPEEPDRRNKGSDHSDSDSNTGDTSSEVVSSDVDDSSDIMDEQLTWQTRKAQWHGIADEENRDSDDSDYPDSDEISEVEYDSECSEWIEN
jgi:hypothetical protein